MKQQKNQGNKNAAKLVTKSTYLQVRVNIVQKELYKKLAKANNTNLSNLIVALLEKECKNNKII